jgi:hypothetical protein
MRQFKNVASVARLQLFYAARNDPSSRMLTEFLAGIEEGLHADANAKHGATSLCKIPSEINGTEEAHRIKAFSECPDAWQYQPLDLIRPRAFIN